MGVIGLGYVGLPLALELARAGFEVTGIDIDGEKVEYRVQDTVNVHFVGIQAVSARKDHELVDQGENSVDFADDETGGLFRASLRRPGREQFRRATDSAERVLDLVSDSGGDVTEGLELVPF